MYYKQLKDPFDKKIYGVFSSFGDGIISFLFIADNTDYQTFKRELAEGVELQDPEGNVMTQEEVDAFLKTIP